MAGNQVRGLVAASKTKGWDPTVIPGYGSIANWDWDPGNANTTPYTNLSDGTADSWPDGYDVPNISPNEALPGPDVSREIDRNRTVNANPFLGFPKGSY